MNDRIRIGKPIIGSLIPQLESLQAQGTVVIFKWNGGRTRASGRRAGRVQDQAQPPRERRQSAADIDDLLHFDPAALGWLANGAPARRSLK